MAANRPVPFVLPSIYPITDKGLAGKPSHLAIVRELIRGGAGLIQIRDKDTPVRELLPDLERCVEYCARHKVPLIVNDRCDLALSSGAAGVHLGQADLPPVAARAVMGKKSILGYSTHSLAQVRQAGGLPIQYIGYGPVYATVTKQSAYSLVGIQGLRRACRQSRLPVVAIGGIGLEQVPEVLAAGAASVAVISALTAGPSIAHRMEALLKAARVSG